MYDFIYYSEGFGDAMTQNLHIAVELCFSYYHI